MPVISSKSASLFSISLALTQLFHNLCTHWLNKHKETQVASLKLGYKDHRDSQATEKKTNSQCHYPLLENSRHHHSATHCALILTQQERYRSKLCTWSYLGILHFLHLIPDQNDAQQTPCFQIAHTYCHKIAMSNPLMIVLAQ
jgi:hypothetical protein